MEKTLIIFSGIVFITAGVGFAFAKSDKTAKEKDEKRFGPLCIFNIGGWYWLIQNKTLKYIFASICLIIGSIFIICGLKTNF